MEDQEPKQPPVIPEYNKPDAPGIWMNFDNTVSLYHVVEPEDTFNDAAGDVFALIKEAQERFPDWPRVLYLDIKGHRGDAKGFEPAFFEFQQEFLIGALGQFLTALALPVTSVVNPDPQNNELPDKMVVREEGEQDDGFPQQG